MKGTRWERIKVNVSRRKGWTKRKEEGEIRRRRSTVVLSSSCCLKFIRRSVYLLKIHGPRPPNPPATPAVPRRTPAVLYRGK